MAMAMAIPLLSLPTSNKSAYPATQRLRPHSFQFRATPITATSTIPPASYSEKAPKPIQPIPGEYGHPILGPIKDRLDFFYHQGRDHFFKSRIEKYKSTVFRVNMPPGPPISPNPNVVVLLDANSFPVLFDTRKVDKKDVFTGTFTPSTDLTGGYRPLSYLDPSEPNHAKLKSLIFSLLKSTRHRVIPEFRANYSELFHSLEAQLAKKNKAEFNDPAEQAAFNFLARAWFGADPARSDTIGLTGPSKIKYWVLFQLAPILTLGLPKCLEEITLRGFRLPSAVIRKDYNKLYDFFYENSTPILEEAAKNGISRDEACHNLVFTTCFNTYGGMNIVFTNLIKLIGKSGSNLHSDLRKEIRSAVKSAGGKVTMAAIENMPLLKSTVYEGLRLEPPVQMQYGRAKMDFVVESHDAAFQVKKGEMLLGFQPFATKDPVIFDRADEFVPERFVGEEGERLLKHVLWSNGPETVGPTVNDKQCAGKDFVVLVARLLVVEIFLRYDSFEIDVGNSPLGCKITVTKLHRASS